MPTLPELVKQADEIRAEIRRLVQKSDLAEDEQALLQELNAKAADLLERIRALKTDEALEEEFKTLVTPDQGNMETVGGFAGGLERLSQKEYRAAFEKYLRYNMVTKDLYQADPTAGGYTVPTTFITELLKEQEKVSAMRRLARVLPPIPPNAAVAVDVRNLVDEYEWTTEIPAQDPTPDAKKPFGGRMLNPHVGRKAVDVSNVYLQNPAFDIEGYVREQLALVKSYTEENAFLNASGNGRPLGLLVASGIPETTTAAAGALKPEELVDWIFSLPAAYAANARILAHRDFVRGIFKMRDESGGAGTGQFLFLPNFMQGPGYTVAGVPIEFSDFMPTPLNPDGTWKSGAVAAVIGDFRYYWIVDSLGLSIQRLVEVLAGRGKTRFLATFMTDGMPVTLEAFRKLTIA